MQELIPIFSERTNDNQLPNDFNRDGISGMRKIEVITLFNANCLAMSNNSLTHSLYLLNTKENDVPTGTARPYIRLSLPTGGEAALFFIA